MSRLVGWRQEPFPRQPGPYHPGTLRVGRNMIATPRHVAVLMGVWSAEREVALMSGAGIADALESLGHRVTRIDMDREVALRLAEATPEDRKSTRLNSSH